MAWLRDDFQHAASRTEPGEEPVQLAITGLIDNNANGYWATVCPWTGRLRRSPHCWPHTSSARALRHRSSWHLGVIRVKQLVGEIDVPSYCLRTVSTRRAMLDQVPCAGMRAGKREVGFCRN